MTNWDKIVLQIREVLFYYKLGQVLQIRTGQLLQIMAIMNEDITPVPYVNSQTCAKQMKIFQSVYSFLFSLSVDRFCYGITSDLYLNY